MIYTYNVEDNQFSREFDHDKLLGTEGQIKKIDIEGLETEFYILWIDDHYIHCIGNVERSFPKNFSQHEEWKNELKSYYKPKKSNWT